MWAHKIARKSGVPRALACCALLALQITAPLQAQDYRPVKPVRIIMSNAVGGPHDITLRGAAQAFSKKSTGLKGD